MRSKPSPPITHTPMAWTLGPPQLIISTGMPIRTAMRNHHGADQKRNQGRLNITR